MARVIVDWVMLDNVGNNYSAIKSSVGQSVDLTVITVTAPGSRPVAPRPPKGTPGMLAARITVLTGQVRVAFGDDPTASATNGITATTTAQLAPLIVAAGDKLSFIEVV